MAEENFSKYERARILGARGLQIAMDAPILLKMDEKELIGLNFDPLKIAEKELEADVLPISVKRPMPEKTSEKLTKIKIVGEKIGDEKKIEKEKEGEKEIVEEGEIMTIANPEDEAEELEAEGGGKKPEEEII